MSEPMSAGDIEDVLSSIRRLVSEELRPAVRPTAEAATNKLILTPAFRVVEDQAEADPKMGATAHDLPAQTPEPVPAPAAAAQAAIVSADAETGGDASLSEPLAPEFVEPAPMETLKSVETEMANGSDLQLILQRLAEQGLPGDEFLDFGASPRAVAKPSDPRIADVVASVGGAVPSQGWTDDPETEFEGAAGWQDADWSDATETAVYMDEVEEAEVLQSVTGQEQRLTSGWADADQWTNATAELAAVAPALDPQPTPRLDADAAEAAALAQVAAETAAEAAQAAADAGLAGADAKASMFDQEDAGFDEEALHDLVREIIREELQGSLGERITRNVRKLVRVEINRVLAARDFN